MPQLSPQHTMMCGLLVLLLLTAAPSMAAAPMRAAAVAAAASHADSALRRLLQPRPPGAAGYGDPAGASRRRAQSQGISFGEYFAAQDCSPCSDVFDACVADPVCSDFMVCSVEQNCGPQDLCPKCLFAAMKNVATLEFSTCLQMHDCLGPSVSCDACDPPRRSAAQVKEVVVLNTLRGTYDVSYGRNKDYDCPPNQQYRFSLNPSNKPGKAFQVEYSMKTPDAPEGYLQVMMDFEAMNTTTGAWKYTFFFPGALMQNTGYVLDSVKQGGHWHVLVGYCGDYRVACYTGGMVLSKHLPGSSRAQLPASIVARFARTLQETGWAARYDAGWDKWCKVPRLEESI